jgi:hypothetical protein
MSVVLGKNIFIYSGDSGTTALIAAAKSCTVSKRVDLIEKASSTQADAKEFTTGRYEWEIAMDHLVTTDAPFDGLLKVGTEYTLSVMIGSTRKTGKAICQQADISGPEGSLAKGNVKFKGNGALT